LEDVGSPATLHGLFERQVALRPDATAISGARTMTYGELDERANRLARYLTLFGAGRGVKVRICLRHSPGIVLTLRAVLKSGSAWVPLDPNQPSERLKLMARDAGIRILVSDERLAAQFAGQLQDASMATVLVNRDAERIGEMPSAPFYSNAGGED